MVTGGVIDSSTDTVTTELSINEGAWFTVSPSGDLPTPRIGLRCVSLNNQVICTGEKINYEICYTLSSYVLCVSRKRKSFIH